MSPLICAAIPLFASTLTLERAPTRGRDILGYEPRDTATCWREALARVFLRPGWSPDGSTLTAPQLRARRAVAPGLWLSAAGAERVSPG